MTRIGRAAVLCGLAVAAAPAPARAQFGGGAGIPAVPQLGRLPTPGLRALPVFPTVNGNPLNFSYTNQFRLYAGTPLGGTGYLTREFYGPAGLWGYNRYMANNYAAAARYYSPLYTPTASAYMTGGVKNAAVDASGQDFVRAQQMNAALRNMPAGARNAIYEQWAYEKLDAPGLAGLRPGAEAPPALAEAVAAPDPAAVASGEALNHVMVAAVAAEGKTPPRIESAYVSPLVLSKVRFAGGPAADAANLLRQPSRSVFPAAFDDGPLADTRPALEKALAAAAAPVQLGKVPTPAQVTALEAAAGRARKELEPAVLDMGFEEAVAARRFLNRVDAAAKALKGSSAAGLVDPRWAAEGVSTADLVRHMTRHKLLFGPAPKGDEDAYLAVQRGLVGYLVGLTEAQKPAAK